MRPELTLLSPVYRNRLPLKLVAVDVVYQGVINKALMASSMRPPLKQALVTRTERTRITRKAEGPRAYTAPVAVAPAPAWTRLYSAGGYLYLNDQGDAGRRDAMASEELNSSTSSGR